MTLSVDGTNIAAVTCDGVNISQVVCDGVVVWTSQTSPFRKITPGSQTFYVPTNRLIDCRAMGGGCSGGATHTGLRGVGGTTTISIYDAETNVLLDKLTAAGGSSLVNSANGKVGAFAPLDTNPLGGQYSEHGYKDCNRTVVYGTGGKGVGAGGGASGGKNRVSKGGDSGAAATLGPKTYSGVSSLKIEVTVGRGGSYAKTCGGTFPSNYIQQPGNGAPGGAYISW